VSALRPFRRPRLWLALWLAMVATVAALSLLPADDLPPIALPHIDKLEHLLGYFALSAGAVMLFATRRAQAEAALGLIGLGVAIELAQAALTATRSADGFDALANTLGVLLGQRLAPTPLARLWLGVDRRLF